MSTTGDGPRDGLAEAYAESVSAISAITVSLDPARLLIRVPACPAWTVRDLLAHLAGVAADTVDGRFPRIDPHGTWAERQALVERHGADQICRRQGMTVGEVIDEWRSYLPRLLAMLRGDQPLPAGSVPSQALVIVSDIGAHNQDLRGALVLPGDRDSAAVVLGLYRYVEGLGRRVTAAGLPAVRLRTQHSDYHAGAGPWSVGVTASEWELFRALGSRRSRSQIRALDWSGDPSPYLDLFAVYGARADDLIE